MKVTIQHIGEIREVCIAHTGHASFVGTQGTAAGLGQQTALVLIEAMRLQLETRREESFAKLVGELREVLQRIAPAPVPMPTVPPPPCATPDPETGPRGDSAANALFAGLPKPKPVDLAWADAEALAVQVYDILRHFDRQGARFAWTPGGNSDAQEVSRAIARRMIELGETLAEVKRSAEASPADGTAHDPNTLPPPIRWDTYQPCDPKRIAGLALMRYREQLTGRHLLAAERDVEDAIRFALGAQLRDLQAVGRLRPQASA